MAARQTWDEDRVFFFAPTTHASKCAKAGACATENPPHHPDEVHYETHTLSYASPTEPTDCSTASPVSVWV